jgi:FMN phosphatase YigB (HAD superfamily)
VRAVPVALFDLDNTLFDRSGAFRTWATHYVEAAGLDPAEVEWFCREDRDGHADRRTVWATAQERFGLEQTVEDLLAAYRAASLECCIPDPTVHQALGALRGAGWRIGVVTNGSMPQQADKVDRLGLRPLIDALCVSAEVGLEKPDRRIFDEAIRRCAGSPPEVSVRPRWMVGDAPGPDVGGARLLGLRTAWLHRGRTWDGDDGPRPDVVVGSVAEAVDEILAAAPAADDADDAG